MNIKKLVFITLVLSLFSFDVLYAMRKKSYNGRHKKRKRNFTVTDKIYWALMKGRKSLAQKIVADISNEKKYRHIYGHQYEKKRVAFLNKVWKYKEKTGLFDYIKGNEQPVKCITALQIALRKGYDALAKQLIELGAHIDLCDFHLVFYIADKKKRLDILQYLIAKGAPINNISQGQSIIGFAVAAGDSDCVTGLIENGSYLWRDEKITPQGFYEGSSPCEDIKKAECIFNKAQIYQCQLQGQIKIFKDEGNDIAKIKKLFARKKMPLCAKIDALDALITNDQQERITRFDLKELYQCVSFAIPEFVYHPSWFFAFHNGFTDCTGKTVKDVLLRNIDLLLQFPEYISLIITTTGSIYSDDDNLKILIAPAYYRDVKKQPRGQENALVSLLQARKAAKKRGNRAFVRALCNIALLLFRGKKAENVPQDVFTVITSYVHPNYWSNLLCQQDENIEN